jgi:rSAM/selenodomain-associated transferase 2
MTLVSIVVPTFDEQAQLPGLLDHLEALPGRWEVLFADGGSRDRTVSIAAERGARVVAAGGGRAGQLNAAARAANGELLLFLHADSRLPGNAHAELVAAVEAGSVGGNFALRFDGLDRFARVLTAAYALQRRFGVYYGDSSIWVARPTFDRLSGYRDLPIMDDYDFVRRLERSGPTACLPGPATSSDRRWRTIGIARTLLSWWLIRLAFLAGVPPARLARLYRRVR